MLTAGRPVRLKFAAELVQEARTSLGFAPYKGGRASDLIQKLTDGYSLSGTSSSAPLFRRTSDRCLEPVARGWKRDWRSMFAPTHRFVRSLAHTGEIVSVPDGSPDTLHRFAPLDPVFPDVEVVVADRDSARNALSTYEAGRRAREEYAHGVPGLYFYVAKDGALYVGETDEPGTRVHSPERRPFSWIVFIARAAEEGPMNSDVLRASEALAITLWREVALVANGNNGSDKAPRQRFQLREASAFVTVASAALLKVHRLGGLGGVPVSIPFRHGLEETYPRWAGTASEEST